MGRRILPTNPKVLSSRSSAHRLFALREVLSVVFVPGGFSARDYGIAVVRSLSVVCLLSVATMGRFTPSFLKFCQWIPSGLISNGLKRHYDPSIFRHIFM